MKNLLSFAWITALTVAGCSLDSVDACSDHADSDGDGVENCLDNCPDNKDKTEPGTCGCEAADVDSDGDTVLDCNDKCPEDPDKLEGGVCGCGKSDKDSDGDKVPDCNDKCPQNDKRSKGSCDCAYDVDEPGICGGCDAPDEDGDTVLDCEDKCPRDAPKTEPGACGCGNVDDDFDLDTVQFTDDDKNRAFLTAPLFTDLKNNYISNLLIDVDFYNNITEAKKNPLHASLANKMVASTLENVGFSGELETVLNTTDTKNAYGCLVGIVDKDSALTDVYATKAKIITHGNYMGGLVGSLESNQNITVKKSSIEIVYTDNKKRSAIGGLFGQVSGNGNITISDVTVDNVSGTNYIGGLIGRKTGTGNITMNSVSVGTVDGKDYTGGVIGEFKNSGTISASQITVDQVAGNDYVGGLFGRTGESGQIVADGLTVKGVSGRTRIGGMIGLKEGKYTIDVDNVQTSSIVGTGSYIGGLIGMASGGNLYIEKAILTNESIQCQNGGGGVIGYLPDGEFSVANINVQTKTIQGGNNIGGVAGNLNFSLSNKTQTFNHIYSHVEQIVYDTNIKQDGTAGGLIGYIRLPGENTSATAQLESIVAEVDSIDVKKNAGMIGSINRGDEDNTRRLVMSDILSIIRHVNVVENSNNFGGFIGYAADRIHIAANRIVSVAVLPDGRVGYALFGNYKGEGRFTPHNVFWYQFGGYTNSTKSAKGTEDQVQELTSDTAGDVVDTMNADSVTKWKLESGVNIGGLQYDIPRPEWQ